MRRLPSEPEYLMNKRLRSTAYKIRKKRERAAIIEITIIAVAMITLFIKTSPLINNFKYRINGVDCEFHCLDFDFGNSIYFECGKENALIDSGDENHAEELVEFLTENNIENIDYLFVSGIDEGYNDSFDVLVDYVDVETVVLSSVGVDTECFEEYIATTPVNMRHAAKGMSFRIGKSILDFIDEDSLLMNISFTDNKFLINNSNDAFEADDHDYDVIIRKRDYATEVIEKESEKSYLTDINGNIVIESNEIDIKIKCEKQ